MPVIRFIGAQLRGRPGRAGALFTGVLVATTGFTVLTGSVTTSKLEVTQMVDANFRAAYDILVRPPGTRAVLETERELIRPNYLSGQFGGITMDQWAKVKRVIGVEVAAPIASLGYATTFDSRFVLDLTDHIDRTRRQQVLRLTPRWIADRGLTSAPDTPIYVYITKNPLITAREFEGIAPEVYDDGTPIDPRCPGPLEVLPSGKKVPVCGTQDDPYGINADRQEGNRTRFYVFRLRPDGTFADRNLGNTGPEPGHGETRLHVAIGWYGALGTAAIDPVEEARLVGLDRAVTAGRYLSTADRLQTVGGGQAVPVIEATDFYRDETFATSVERLGQGALATGLGPARLRAQLAASAGTPLIELTHRSQPGGLTDISLGLGSRNLAGLYQPGATSYATRPDGTLAPVPVPPSVAPWVINGISAGEYNMPPVFAGDTAFRSLTYTNPLGNPYHPIVVGEFDATRITGFAAASAVPLETYRAPELTGADAETRRLLGDRSLRPNSNPAGYLTEPPLVLTTLQAATDLFKAAGTAQAPISAIRVRVAGVRHFDDVTRERIRRVAEQITLATGLDVDITVGSSPSPQTIALSAGKFGRPELKLSEGWSRKGVAVAIIKAIDRKSAILFGLILAVCLLFLGNAATAAVRDRRRELAVLACFGWPRRRLAQMIVLEVGALGLAAGLTAALLAFPISDTIDVDVSPRHAALAIPVAVGLSILAALIPAVRASRTHPAAALAPVGITGRRRRWGRPRTVLGLALRNALRLRGRTALGVLAMALGIGALTVIAALELAFHGEITGSLLGEVVSVRVRGVDAIAVVATVLLAAAAVGDVLYLNVRERAAELAALRATGWSELSLARLVAYEGLLIGTAGAAIGAGLGMLAVSRLAGAPSPQLVHATAIAGAVGVCVAAAAALIPALLTRRLPLTTLLAEE